MTHKRMMGLAMMRRRMKIRMATIAITSETKTTIWMTVRTIMTIN
jgi:hypothetical protein